MCSAMQASLSSSDTCAIALSSRTASVNVLPQMESIYSWINELRESKEHKMFINTREARLGALRWEIRAAHPCAIAQILYFIVDSGDFECLDWITQLTQ